MRVFSFGGGVQSTAALVLAAQGELQVDAFLFANVGDDSEHPATLQYVREVAMPYAERHGIALHELRRVRKDGSEETLMERMQRSNRDIPIPVRLHRTGAPAKRSCTKNFKVDVINKWLRGHGATARKPATVLLGISLDEWHRMRTDSPNRYTIRAYPLVDRRLTRQDCMNVIATGGLPVPPKSSCYFCPFHRIGTWREMRDNEPELFAKAVALEAHLNTIAAKRGDRVYLTGKRKPLALAVGEGVQPSLFGDGQFEDDACESGYCVA